MKVKMLGYYTKRWKAKQHENEAGRFSWVESKMNNTNYSSSPYLQYKQKYIH